MMTLVVLVGERVLFVLRHLPQPSLTDWRFDASNVALVALFCVLCRWFFVVHVGPDGLRTVDGIGRYHDVRWDAMRRVTNVLGFLLVPYGKPGAALLFPIFLDRSAEFRDYVMSHAPEENPLRTYLAPQ